MAVKKITIADQVAYSVDGIEKWKDLISKIIDVTELTVVEMVLPFTASNIAVSFGGITAGKFLRVITDLPITGRVNGSVSDLPIDSELTITGNGTTSITALTLSNPSPSVDANVKIIIGQ